jgi:hypothetical protein
MKLFLMAVLKSLSGLTQYSEILLYEDTFTRRGGSERERVENFSEFSLKFMLSYTSRG